MRGSDKISTILGHFVWIFTDCALAGLLIAAGGASALLWDAADALCGREGQFSRFPTADSRLNWRQVIGRSRAWANIY